MSGKKIQGPILMYASEPDLTRWKKIRHKEFTP